MNFRVFIRFFNYNALLFISWFHWHLYLSNGAPLRDDIQEAQRVPSAIVIGVKKSGTRALLEFVRLHPDVRAPGPEPHFFDKNFELGLEYYRSLMPPSNKSQMTIEKTPSYFVTPDVPERIFAANPNMKLIVVVRDPVIRAISDYTQRKSKHPNLGRFEDLAFVDKDYQMVDIRWGAIKIGLYSRYVTRWLQYFPRRQLHFVNGESLISDPASEIQKVQQFLDLKPVIKKTDFMFNQTKGFPCVRKQTADGSYKPKCLGRTKGRTHPKIDASVIERLRDFYRPYNELFYEMVGQNFGWP